MNATKTEYRVSDDEGHSAVVTSEREARRLAREWLGVDRVSEYPTTVGWDLYPAGSTDEAGPVVHVVVVAETR